MLPAGSLAFTVCQTPVVYLLGEGSGIAVTYLAGRTVTQSERCLDPVTTRHIFERDGHVEMLQVSVAI
jgi:hypothetical protein